MNTKMPLSTILASLVLFSPTVTAEQTTRPNIVFILADDQGWADIGYHDSDIRTPTLDALAAAGTRLHHHYVYPTCSPTRVALLSGQFPSRFGVLAPLGSTTKMRGDDALLPRTLQQLGYRTHISGKWHIGETPEHRPLGYGFDTSYGYLRGQIDPYTHRYKFGDHVTWHRNDEFVDERGHVTDLITEEALRVIEQSDDRPFFLYVAHHSPHSPLNEPPSYIDAYQDDIEDIWRRHFAAAVTHVDEGVGQIVEALDRAGKLENTLIVYSSDNGGQQHWNATENQYNGRYAAHQTLGNNQPLRGWKGQLYEGGIRVPAFVHWPAKIPSGQIFDSATHTVDWLPTLVRVAGGNPAELKAAEGVDLWAALTETSAELPDRPMYWKTPRESAVRQGDWKLIVNRRDDSRQLFNLANDPYEEQDRAEQEPQRADRLAALLDELADRDG